MIANELWYYYSYQYCYEQRVIDEDQYDTGFAILLVAKIWELFDAYDAVEDYNYRLKQGLDLAYGIDPYYNLTVGLTYRFLIDCKLIITVSFS